MMFGLRAITDMDSGLSVDPIVSNAAAEIAATSGTPVAVATPAPATSDTMPLLLLAAAGVAAYWWYSKKHKGGGVKLPTFDLMGVQL
jgi:hypothetical protein